MKAQQTTYWLPETLACDRKRDGGGGGSTLCQESFSIFAKNWAHSSGLSLRRLAAAFQAEVHTQMPANMASTNRLWFNTKLGFCLPKHNKETQNGVLHIGHFRSVLKHYKVHLSGLLFFFFSFFFLSLLRDEERAAVISRVMKNQSRAKHWDKASRPRWYTRSRVPKQSEAFLIRQLDTSEKSMIT